MFNIFNKIDKRSIGIDIGESSLKLVDISRDNDTLILNNYTELQLGKYSGKENGDTVKLGDDQLRTAMQDMYIESKTDCKNITVGIPMSACQMKIIKFPIKSKPFLSDLIELEFRRYTIIPISELSITHNIVKEDIESLWTLVLAVKTKEVERINYATNFIKKENYKIEPSIFGLMRHITDNNPGMSMVIDFGASMTSILFILDNKISGVESFRKGINEIVMNIKVGLSLDYKEAHQKFFDLDILNDKDLSSQIAFSTMHHICEEVMHMQNSFSIKFQVKCSNIYISGGGSKINNILSFLEKEFEGVKINKINAFERLSMPEAIKNLAIKNSPTYNNAVGLAMSDIN